MVLANCLIEVEIAEAASLEEALLLVHEHVDLILLDVQLDGLNGLDGLPALKRKWPEAKVVIVSAAQDAHIRNEALALGAHAFISKAESPARMLEQVGQVLAGQLPGHTTQTSGIPDKPLHLSPRQSEVLQLLCQGLPNKLIGRRLNLSENTVRGHVQAILLVLKVSSRSEAAFVARRMGLTL